jgi:D-alanyl-D-alanine dipeptidase
VADLVDIKEVNSRIIVDIKYATEDNFTKKSLYDSNICFLMDVPFQDLLKHRH